MPAMGFTIAGTPPLINPIVPAPAVAVSVPPQPVEAFGAAATTRLAGRESLTDRLVSAKEFVLVSVIVRVEVPFVLIMFG